MRNYREYGKKYREAIIGRLDACYAIDDSDAELERILSSCVCGDWLVSVAKQLRDDGVQIVSYPREKETYQEPVECDYFRLLYGVEHSCAMLGVFRSKALTPTPKSNGEGYETRRHLEQKH